MWMINKKNRADEQWTGERVKEKPPPRDKGRVSQTPK